MDLDLFINLNGNFNGSSGSILARRSSRELVETLKRRKKERKKEEEREEGNTSETLFRTHTAQRPFVTEGMKRGEKLIANTFSVDRS